MFGFRNGRDLMKKSKNSVKPRRSQLARLWRTLVRVEAFDDNYVHIVLPSWNHRVTLRLNRKDIPANIQAKLAVDYRCHAKVNTGADRWDQIRLTNWEDS